MPMNFRQPRDWNLATISRGHDTRATARKGGGHGSSGTLTFSIPVTIAQDFLRRHCNGHPFVHMRIEKRGDSLLLFPVGEGERGRKFSLSSDRRDYRIFFDPSNYEWIGKLEPFAATETEVSIADGGILVAMPPKEARKAPQPYLGYQARVPRQTPAVQRPYPERDHAPTTRPEPLRTGTPGGNMYLVMVPHEVDEKFHTLLRFLKLEALKE